VRQLGDLLDASPSLDCTRYRACQSVGALQRDGRILKATATGCSTFILHDNKGGEADLHLPLGSGNIDTAHYVRSLQNAGFDGTITLEVLRRTETISPTAVMCCAAPGMDAPKWRGRLMKDVWPMGRKAFQQATGLTTIQGKCC